LDREQSGSERDRTPRVYGRCLPSTAKRSRFTTAEREATFDKALNKYNRQNANYVIAILLSIWGGEHCHFVSKRQTTVEDMVEAFRSARRYSKKRIIKIRHDGKILDPQMKVLDIANIKMPA
jgi:DNA polymerase II small subunit/DNA polymerase delta subunit B